MSEERIPWFKMPTKLRALPFDERKTALAEYEMKHGKCSPETMFNEVK